MSMDQIFIIEIRLLLRYLCLIHLQHSLCLLSCYIIQFCYSLNLLISIINLAVNLIYSNFHFKSSVQLRAVHSSSQFSFLIIINRVSSFSYCSWHFLCFWQVCHCHLYQNSHLTMFF